MDFDRSMGWLAPMMEPAPAIGLARLAAVLRLAGHDVSAIDSYALRLTVDETLNKLARTKPDLIGIGVLTPSAPYVERLARSIRERLPEVRIVLGNVHASVFAEDYVTEGLADVVVHGEGEKIIGPLIKALEDDGDLGEVRGITFNDGTGPVTTEKAPPIDDLDSLPRPAWDLFPYKKYGMLPFVTLAKPALMVEGSRGCPYGCDFCALRHMGRKYRMRSAQSVVEEIEWLRRRFGARQIAFADAIFPLTEKQGFEFCDRMRSSELAQQIIWSTETRTDLLTRDLVQAMKSAGCKRILFGIESGSQSTLNNVNKKLDVNAAERAIEYCREAGLQTVGFFILGLPGETEEAAQQTIDLALSLPLDFAKFNITVPYPGSELFNRARANGQLRHTKWEDYSCYVEQPENLALLLADMPAETLIRLQKDSIRKFYLRPSMIAKHLFLVRTIEMKYLVRAGTHLLADQIAAIARFGKS
jgi:radical SAM superfamily enzyme YgiQ (UPF0313 family)